MPFKSIFDVFENIVKRTERYMKKLQFPFEGSERMLRGWILIELLFEYLGWPSENIVHGEVFDILLVNDRIKPVLYIETKALKENINPNVYVKEIEKILKRTKRKGTVKILILTNAIHWIVYDLIPKPNIVLNIKNIIKSNQTEVDSLKKFLNPKRYIVK